MDSTHRRWLYALPVLFILGVTLWPVTGMAPTAVAFCIACGRRGVADGVLNAMLFFPLGFIPIGGSRSFARRVFAGLLLSVFIELTQIFVPGRDPSLSDVMFNTIGTILGAYAARMRRTWVAPDSKDSRILTAVGVVAVLVIATATVLSLSPVDFSEWTTHHLQADLTRADRSGSLELVAQVPVTRRGETATIYRWSDALGVAYPSWAAAHGLDEPIYWSYHVLKKHKPPLGLALDIGMHRCRVILNSEKSVSVGPSVGLGWALLLYPDAISPGSVVLLDALWLFGLCFPIGYWSSRRHFIAACGSVIAGFLLLSLVTAAPVASLPEWVGVGLGFLVGKSAGALRVPWRSDHRAERSQAEGA